MSSPLGPYDGRSRHLGRALASAIPRDLAPFTPAAQAALQRLPEAIRRMFVITEPDPGRTLRFSPRPDALAYLASVLQNLGEKIVRDPARPERFHVRAPARLTPDAVHQALRDLQPALKATGEDHLYTHPTAIQVKLVGPSAYRVQRTDLRDAPERLRASLTGQELRFVALGRDTQVVL